MRLPSSGRLAPLGQPPPGRLFFLAKYRTTSWPFSSNGMPINGWLSWTSKLGNGCRFRSAIFLTHSLSFETLRENLAPFPHYTTCQENAENQVFATHEIVLSLLRVWGEGCCPILFYTPVQPHNITFLLTTIPSLGNFRQKSCLRLRQCFQIHPFSLYKRGFIIFLSL